MLRILRGSFENRKCRVLNTSRGGLKIFVSEPLDPGTMVQVRFSNLLVMAEVRYCLSADKGYHVGVKVEDTMRLATKDESER
jgi:hypothetical protein